MREKIKDQGRLEHILSAINTILEHKQQYTLDDIKDSPVVFYGFVKLVEIIGEAVYMLTKEFRNAHQEVPWAQIERMRHVLVHGYYTINADDLWATIEEDIPTLKQQIEKLLPNTNEKDI
jgi:uncharacterized protein with HEPN domain